MGLKPVLILSVGYFLGAEEAGRLAIAYGWAGVCAVLFFLAMGTIVLDARFATRMGSDGRQILGAFAGLLALGLVLSLAATGVLIGMRAAIFRGVPPSYLLLAVASVVPLAAEPYALGLHQVRGDLLGYNRILIFTKSAFLALLLLFLGLGAGTGMVLVGLAISNLTTFWFLARAATRPHGLPSTPDAGLLRHLVREGLQWWPQQVGGMVVAQSYVFFVNAYSGLGGAGHLAIASQLVLGGMVIPISISMIVSSRIARPDHPDQWRTFRRFVVPTVLVSTAFAVALPAAAHVAGLLGLRIVGAVEPLLLVLCIGIPAQAFSFLMLNQWVVRGQGKWLTLVYVVQACFIVALLAWLVPGQKEAGAAIAAAVSNVLVALAHVLAFLRWERQWRHGGTPTGARETPT